MPIPVNNLKLPPRLLELARRLDPLPVKPLDTYACPHCHDAGFYILVDQHDKPVPDESGSPLRRCRCKQPTDSARRRAALEALDGLTPAERRLRFAHLIPGSNGPAIAAVEQAVAAGHGLLTLSGRPGSGKSALLICAVNAAREQGIPAVYTTMTDLLDYLRAAFDAEASAPNFDARWKLIGGAELLALDEVDEFHASGWALERFLRLIDERWRALETRLTLIATNAHLDALPEKVSSRLRDGRAQRFTMHGPDLRPYQSAPEEG